MGVIWGLRLFIWKRTITGLYGEEFWRRLRASVDVESMTAADKLVDQLGVLYGSFEMPEPPGGFDTCVIAYFLDEIVDRSLSPARKDAMVNEAHTVLKIELFMQPAYVRYLLRCAIQGPEAVAGSGFEDAL